MVAGIVIVILAALNAWFGWKKRIRGGWFASVLLPAIISLIAAFTISLPTDAGGPWVFAMSFVVLAGVSLASLGLARCVRWFLFRD
jgi:hypothetical protein